MTISPELVAALSREVALVCDASGVVTWADERARRLLSVEVGKPLAACAITGTEDKVRALFDQVVRRPIDGWELVLLAGGEPRTMSFHAVMNATSVALVGSLVSSDYAVSMSQLTATMSELATLHRELVARQAEIARLNLHLNESAKGMLVLNQEIDEKNESILRTLNAKTRVMADLGHELRTPINAVLSLSRLLLSGHDGTLNGEQTTQVGFIQRSAETLSGLVDELLQLSKLDAGRVALRITRFSVEDVFAALRGMLRPLIQRDDVALIFEAPPGLPTFETDEGKLSQVLRNLISNAIKFTERGEVRVTVTLTDFGAANFEVRDTGVGISQEAQHLLFREFVQIDNPLQGKARGTGLGLSISKRLATLLAGEIHVKSELGKGSAFTLTLPIVHPEANEMHQLEQRSRAIDPDRQPVLVVEDDRATQLVYDRYLPPAGFQVVPAMTIDAARERLRALRPAAIVLDIMLEQESSWELLASLKADPRTRDIPVIVVTNMSGEERARALGADDFFLKPVDPSWLVKKLMTLSRRAPVKRVLLVDEDDTTRYLVRRYLEGSSFSLVDARSTAEGLRLLAEVRPHAALIDVGADGGVHELLDVIERDQRVQPIPVIVMSTHPISASERERLSPRVVAALAKKDLSRPALLEVLRSALAPPRGA